jgi:hypothetical protein
MSLTRKQKRLALAGVVLLLLLALWWLDWRNRAHARVERVKRLQRELLSEEGRVLPPDQLRAKLLRLLKV